jgi:hypothetical protein
MAKNGKDAGKQHLLSAINDRKLIAQIANQGLRHGAANRRHARSSRNSRSPSMGAYSVSGIFIVISYF